MTSPDTPNEERPYEAGKSLKELAYELARDLRHHGTYGITPSHRDRIEAALLSAMKAALTQTKETVSKHEGHAITDQELEMIRFCAALIDTEINSLRSGEGQK